MVLGIPTASLTLGRLMADPFRFVVPPYQRGYAWTVKEAGQLLEDVVAASGVDNDDLAEEDYFLGSVLLMSASGSLTPAAGAPPHVHEIVDGQQRLVTLSIIACVLRDLEADASSATARALQSLVGLPDGDASGSWRLVMRGRQQAFIERCVLQPGSCGEMPDEADLGRAESRMLEIREEFLTTLSELDSKQRAGLATYLAEKCHFVVMQTHDIDRAHRLFLVLNGRGRPLARNDILKAEVLSSLPQDSSEAVTEAWEETAERLGPEQFEAFFSHVRTIHGQRRPQIIAGMRSVIESVGGGETFLETVFKPLAEVYRAILNAEHHGSRHSPSIRQSLVYLNRLSGTEWVPVAMIAMDRLKDDPGKLAQVLSEIDRFAYVLRILCLGRGKRVTRFAALMDALRSGQSIGEACRFDRDERKSIAYHLRDLHVRSPQVCKLVLLRLNDRLAGRVVDADPREWSIEHVLPKRPSEASQWRVWFQDNRQRETATESLGNLVLVTSAVNEKARNQTFERKKHIYLEGGRDDMLPLRADVLSQREWRAHEIAERQSRLFALLDEMWGLGLESMSRAGNNETAQESSRGRRRLG